jgi:hypothetical protein
MFARAFATFVLVYLSLAIAASSRADDGSWQELPPPIRSGAPGVYDSVHDRYLIYGPGLSGDWGGNEMWTLDPSAKTGWQRVPTARTAPRTFSGATAIHDPAHERILHVGDRDNGAQVWTLDLRDDPTWWLSAATTGGPEQRIQMGVVYDSTADRLVFFGGRGPHPTLGTVSWNEVWALDLATVPTWHRLTTTGTSPGVVARPAVTLDPVKRRMLVLRGVEFWELDLATLDWTLLSSSAPTFNTAELVVDTARGRMLIHGRNYAGSVATQELWEVPLAGGAFQLLATSPLPHPTSNLALDPERSQLLLHDGEETWRVDLAGAQVWTKLGPPLLGLRGHGDATVMRDPESPRLLVFGGSDEDHSENPARTWDLNGVRGWEPYAGGAPPAWFALDARRREIVGVQKDNFQSIHVLDLAIDAWRLRSATNVPDHSFDAQAAIVDSLTDRLLLIGAAPDPVFQVEVTTVWALPLDTETPTWTRLRPTGGPPQLTNHPADPKPLNALVDARRERILIFGQGKEAWELSFAGATAGDGTWTHLGDFPIFMYEPSAGLDAANDRVFVFYADEGRILDVWMFEWSLAQPPSAARRLFPTGEEPLRGYFWCGGMDPATNRLYLVGGPQGFWSYNPANGTPPPLSEIALTCAADVAWGPGSSIVATATADVTTTTATHVSYEATSVRNWPGFPVSGTAPIAGGVANISFAVLVPDSVSAGENAITITALLESEDVADSCTLRLLDPSSGPGPDPDPVVTSIGTPYPNPASGAATLRVHLVRAATVRATVRKLTTGQVVLTLDYGSLPAGPNALPLPLSDALPSGAYTVLIEADGQANERKLILVR